MKLSKGLIILFGLIFCFILVNQAIIIFKNELSDTYLEWISKVTQNISMIMFGVFITTISTNKKEGE